ncbi:MAG: DsbA family protein [Actinomycetota bacterium]|nr:DsbA family protein [Actinomycetota bacterium]
MVVDARLYTDPACVASWTAQSQLRRLAVDFGEDLRFTLVMGGLARSFEGRHAELFSEWLEAADRSGMPLDPRLWTEGPIGASYPACMAVKAAAEQGPAAAARCLRALQEGLFCFRRKLDTVEALVEEARGAGLDAGRFRIDLGSNAIVEAFGKDLEEVRAAEAPLPSVRFGGEGWIRGPAPYEAWRAAALEAGAVVSGDPPPDVLTALRRFGRMAEPEVEAVCDLPGPRARAELWRLASEWRARPQRVLTGWLWEPA